MIIEYLYPELANLYGESGHRRFLQKLFPTAEHIDTALSDIPAFSERAVDFIFMGALSESAQEKAITALSPHREALLASFERGCHALFSGNAAEVLGIYIDTGTGERLPALGLFPFHAVRQMEQRLNCFYLGKTNAQYTAELEKRQLSTAIVGFKTQFSQCYLDEGQEGAYFCQTEKGFGLNQQDPGEGYVYKNVLCTYLIGPLLILNPDFCKLFLDDFLGPEAELPFEASLQAAYRARLEDFRKHDTVL